MLEINDNILAFIKANADGDVRNLAFKAASSLGNDATFALEQIAGRQTARHKLPSWFATEGIIYPPHLSMEQCSSEWTARYKVAILDRLNVPRECELVDMTGGFAVDFSFMAQCFEHCTYTERMPHLCDIARHNLPLLGLEHAKVVCEESDGTKIPMESVIFIDPARRDKNGARTYAIGDCTPNILDFIGNLTDRAKVVIVKLSPMLDWHSCVADINANVRGGDAVREVHIVSVGNECKELLLVISTKSNERLTVHCVNDNERFSFTPPAAEAMPSWNERDASFLLVPNASVMKAGCFSEVGKVFGICQVSPNSHLFVSNKPIAAFPGRNMQISAVSSMNKKDLKRFISLTERANVACRNFPLNPEELRKRLKVKDGGTDFIYATTTASGKHLLFLCKPDTEEGAL